MNAQERLKIQALHHDALSRHAAVSALQGLAYTQSQNFQSVLLHLHADERADVLERTGLWGTAPVAETPSGSGAIKESPLLEHLLPEWYALHNARCPKCRVPTVPSLARHKGKDDRHRSSANSSRLPRDRRIRERTKTCAFCSKPLPLHLPNESIKAAFPSTRGRHRSDQRTPRAAATAVDDDIPTHESESQNKVLSSPQQRQPLNPPSTLKQVSVTASAQSVSATPPPPPPALSLDERKKRMRAEKRKAEAELKRLQARNLKMNAEAPAQAQVSSDGIASSIATTTLPPGLKRSLMPSLASSSTTVSPTSAGLTALDDQQKSKEKRKIHDPSSDAATQHTEANAAATRQISSPPVSRTAITMSRSSSKAAHPHAPLSARERDKAAAKSHRAGLKALLAQSKSRTSASGDRGGSDEKNGGKDKSGSEAGGLAAFLQKL